MSSYSSAFGYSTYLVPVAAANVDLTFTGITGGVGAGASNFIDTTTVVDTAHSVTYAAGVFTVNSAAFDMDGTDPPAKLIGLTNAALETDTDSEDVVTYDDTSLGFAQSLPTGKSWSVSLAGVADFKDAAYQIMRLTEQNTVADALRVKFGRVGPTGTTETIYGYGTISGYSESIEAGSIVSWEAEVVGYGPYKLVVDAT